MTQKERAEQIVYLQDQLVRAKQKYDEHVNQLAQFCEDHKEVFDQAKDMRKAVSMAKGTLAAVGLELAENVEAQKKGEDEHE